MSSYYTTRAIILREEPWREQDLRLDVLTEREGRGDYILRGGRAIYSKLRPHAMVFDRTTLTVAVRGTASYITQAHLEQRLSFAKNFLTRHRAAAVACALVRLARADIADIQKLFQTLDRTLIDLNNRQENFLCSLAPLLLDILQISGITPLLEQCRTCRQNVTANQALIFSIQEGAVFHQSCAHPLASEKIESALHARLRVLMAGNHTTTDQTTFRFLIKFAKFHLEYPRVSA